MSRPAGALRVGKCVPVCVCAQVQTCTCTDSSVAPASLGVSEVSAVAFGTGQMGAMSVDSGTRIMTVGLYVASDC